MFYLIGLGLNEKGYSREAYDAIMESDKIYFDNYTVEFPYKIKDLEKQFPKKKFISANREFVENFGILDEAKKHDVVLLVYGSPLTATTHISLIAEAKKRKIKIKIIHGASIFDAVAETGLQLYKFSKITSMPGWEKNFAPESFIDVVKENLSINAHSLILVDIGLDFQKALEQLEISARNKKLKLEKIIVCSKLGMKNQEIFYGEIRKLKKKKIEVPFCFIISTKVHFVEQEYLKTFSLE